MSASNTRYGKGFRWPSVSALAFALPAFAAAQPTPFDGTWQMHLSCSANNANNRPPFEWTAQVKVERGRFVHRRSAEDANPAKAYEEIWNGNFSGAGTRAQLGLSAKGSRPDGDRWELRFADAPVRRGQADLSGAVYSTTRGQEIKVRSCTAGFKQVDEPVAAKPALQPASPKPAPAAAPAVPALPAVTVPPVPVAVPASPKPAATPAVPATPQVAAQPAPAAAKPSLAPAPAAAPAKPRSIADLRRALYDDPGFDLALVVLVKNSGGLKRSLDGKWTVGQGGVSVSTYGVLASDLSYDLRGFGNLAPAERKTTVSAGPFYKASVYHPNPMPGDERKGFSGPTPKVSAGVPSGPGPKPTSSSVEANPGKALDAALGQAVGRAFEAAVGAPVRFGLTYQTTANVVLVPRLKVDPAYDPPRVQGQWIVRLEQGEAQVLGFITQEQLRQGLKAQVAAVSAADQREADLLARLKGSPASGPDSLIGAVAVSTGVNVKPCALKSELDLAPYLLKHEPIGGWITQGAPKWSAEASRGVDTAEALFEELKVGRRCSAAFGNGPLIATLASALDRDRVGNIVYPQPQTQRAVLALKAKALGFDDLAAFEFAESIGSRDPRQVKALKGLGVTGAGEVQAARERLKKYDPRAGQDLDVLLALLQDEADARKQGVSIEKLQAARAEREARQAKEAAAARKENDKRMAKDFPFVLTLRCRIGTSSIGLEPCLREDSVDTELELRNGDDYRMYKIYDVQTLGRRTDDGVEVDLRQKFSLRVQNASKTAVLDVVIRDRLAGSIKYQQSAGQFKVIAVQN